MKNFHRPDNVTIVKIFISEPDNPVLPPIRRTDIIMQSMQEAGMNTAGFIEHSAVKSVVHVEWPKIIINYTNVVINSTNNNSNLPVIQYVVPNQQLANAVTEIQQMSPGVNPAGHLLDRAALYANGGDISSVYPVHQMGIQNWRELVDSVGLNHLLTAEQYYANVSDAVINAATDDLRLSNCVSRIVEIYNYNPEFIAILGLIAIPGIIGSVGVQAALITTVDWASHMDRSLNFFANLRDSLLNNLNRQNARNVVTTPTVNNNVVVPTSTVNREEVVVVHREIRRWQVTNRNTYIIEVDPITYRIFSTITDPRFFFPVCMFSAAFINTLTPEKLLWFVVKKKWRKVCRFLDFKIYK